MEPEVKEQLSSINTNVTTLSEKAASAEKEAKKATEEATAAKTAADAAKKSADDTKTAVDELKEANDKNQKAFDDIFIQVKNGGLNGGQKTIGDQLESSLNEKATNLEAMKDNMKGSVSLSVKAFSRKAAGTMTIANNYTGGTIGLTSWDGDFARIQRRQPFMRQLVSVRPTTSKYVAWAEQANPDGGADMTAEGTKKSQADFDIAESTAEVKKITAFIKASKEALADISYLASEINQELIELINLKLDSQILTGDGTGLNLKGILSYAPSFSVTGTDLENGVLQANNYDALRAAAWQVTDSLFQANYFVINPVDAAVMDLTKTDQGAYVIPPFTTQDGRRIAGMVGVENTGVTRGSFLVGDFTKDILAMREELNISIGYENDDFTKNLITILAEARAANYIKSNYVKAFVQGTFAAAKAALQAA